MPRRQTCGREGRAAADFAENKPREPLHSVDPSTLLDLISVWIMHHILHHRTERYVTRPHVVVPRSAEAEVVAPRIRDRHLSD